MSTNCRCGDPANVGVTGARSLVFIRAGKSAGALYRIFMKHRGHAAVQFLRRVRMRHARNRLLAPVEEDTVTSIALECGFTHLSRFAGDYRRQYGERPSETIRKIRESPPAPDAWLP